MNNSLYDTRPIEVIESLQNYKVLDTEGLSLKEIKTEYKNICRESKDLQKEIDNLPYTSLNFLVKERLENNEKEKNRIKKKLKSLGITTPELDKLEKEAKSSYDKK